MPSPWLSLAASNGPGGGRPFARTVSSPPTRSAPARLSSSTSRNRRPVETKTASIARLRTSSSAPRSSLRRLRARLVDDRRQRPLGTATHRTVANRPTTVRSRNFQTYLQAKAVSEGTSSRSPAPRCRAPGARSPSARPRVASPTRARSAPGTLERAAEAHQAPQRPFETYERAHNLNERAHNYERRS